MSDPLAVGQEHAHWSRLIIKGGGVYVGIQVVPGREDLVLFNDPANGTTLSLPANQVSPEAVTRRIAESRGRR